MKKAKFKLLLVLLFCCAVIATILLLAEHQQRQNALDKANALPSTNPVAVLELKPQTWQPVLESTGIINPEQGATLSIQASGIVKSVFYQSGDQVKKGEVILALDSGLEQAQLEAAIAQYNGAKSTFNRYAELVKTNGISRLEYDQAKTSLENLAASIKSAKETIERRKVVAPFDGKLGVFAVREGQYLSAATPIVSLENMTGKKIIFSVSQDDLSKLHLGQEVTAFIPSLNNQAFTAHISAIDPSINTTTGLIRVEAKFAPTEDRLLSGMYAKVNVSLQALPDQMTVPQIAISYALSGDSVFIVKDLAADDKNKDKFGKPVYQVRQVNVNVLDRRGVNALVESKDLHFGDKLVIAGMQRLKNKGYVTVDEKSDAVGTVAPAVKPMF